MLNIPRVLLASTVLVSSLCLANAAPVINEIMFHPLGSPAENVAQEWIEIFNPDAAAVNVSGWKLTSGVTFTIPASTTIPAGGYLVIAANVATFNTDHPGFSGVIGGWTGRLSNSGEQIQLDDATGTKVNDVSYADEGDWGLRVRGPIEFGATVSSINTSNEQITTTASHGFSTGQFVSVAATGTFPASTPSLSGGTTYYYVRSVSSTVLKLYTTLADANADTNPINFTGSGTFVIGHKGWDWYSDADGGGKTLELRNPALGNGSGQNWGVSTAVGGSPGAANSLASANIAPLIKDVKHRPQIPHSTDPIVVSCNLEDEAPGGAATLHWRVDGAGSFNSLAMSDTDADGDVEATILPQANLAVIEWYVSATDGTNTRTWPAPARTSDPGVLPETFGQVTNALIQVDNNYDPNTDFTVAGNQPIYRLIMTNAERAELVQIGTTNGQEDSEATMNGTFISHDGTGIDIVYNAGFRNRGFGSALGPPNNYHVSLRSDDKWNGRSSMALNCRAPYSQALGNAIFDFAGIPPQEPAIVRVRVNGVDLAETGARMYGRYVRLEGRGGEWAETHYPNDSEGNFYRLDDHDTGGSNPQGDLGSGEFRYEGTNPEAYNDTYFKETNQDDPNGYADLINLCRVISASPTADVTAGDGSVQPKILDADYPAAVGAVLDVDEFYRFIAVDALIGNQEGGLQSGRADDVSLYRGVNDPRFRFIPHDMDAVFYMGEGFAGNPITRPIFSYDFNFGTTTPGTGILGLTRMFSHPQLVPRHYTAVLDALNTWFNHATLDPIIDQIMSVWVPATNGSASPPNDSIAEIKALIDARRTNVIAQIPGAFFSAPSNLVLLSPPTLTVTTAAANTTEGYKQTTDGAATFGGTFNVAKTYSITVNGVLATWFYRPSGPNAAGTWTLSVGAGGGGVLYPGLNKVIVKFWDGINGSGSVLQSLTADVFYNTGGGTTVSGTLSAGSLRLTAPSSYVPGKPFLARVELLDAQGKLNRAAWDTTVTLSSNVGGIALPAVQLYNGQGSALITAGGGGGAPPTVLFSYGTGGNGTAGSGTPGSQWKEKSDFNTTTLATFITNVGDTWRNEGFNDSTWIAVNTQAGYGNNDENTPIPHPDYDPATPLPTSENVPCYLFRNTFTIADVSAIASVTGNIKYDDGYAIYVNGVDINQRANLPAGTALSSYSSGTSIDNATAPVTIPLNVLHNGVNTIAVDVRQGNATSSDVTFDLQLQANYPSADPGNFTLTATGGGFSAQKSITSLGTSPTYTIVTGPTISANTTWMGLIRVTGNVTVNTGVTLTIAAGTNVFVDGDATVGGHNGKTITINGTLNINGTGIPDSPVHITATNANERWGQLVFSNAQPSTLNYALISNLGRGPTSSGHTGRTAMISLNTSTLTMNDSVFGDGPGKALLSSGNCTLTIERSLINRTVTGPELNDNCGLLCEDSNIQFILPNYREDDPGTGGNEAAPDDEDCMYVHNGTSRSVVMRRSVFARCGDDLFDCLGGPITVEDSILREGWDKGMSLLNNDLTISRTQIIQCDKAIVPKSNAADTRTVTATNLTIVSENHDTSQAPWGYPIPPSNPDPDSPSTGFYTQNKAGQSNTGATLAINAKNCIVIAQSPVLIDSPYNPANTVVTYSDLALLDFSNFTWVGAGNISANPLFVAAASGNYNIAAGSPCRDTGDPATFDPDLTRADMGALPYSSAGAVGTITWTPAGAPYHVTGDVTIPVGTTLVIQPGTNVHVDENKHILVNGKVQIVGDANHRITLSGVPNLPLKADPADPGLPLTTPKWGGLWIENSMNPDNVISYVDFVDAQDMLSGSRGTSRGCIELKNSEALIDHCTFRGTHLHIIYCDFASVTIQYCTFPDMFAANETPGALDNVSEHIKMINKFPAGGHCILLRNTFGGNKGHNDVIDIDSNVVPNPILQVRENIFNGQTGDEDLDLGGDVFIDGNVFSHGMKDQWNTPGGYASAFTTGDAGGGTTIVASRNIFWDMDHATALKSGTGTIFEQNTAFKLHATYNDPQGRPQRASVITFVVPEEGTTPGDGAYLGSNIFWSLPNVLGQPDVGTGGVGTFNTKLQADYNDLDPQIPTTVGANHPGGFFSLGVGNFFGDPKLIDPDHGDFRLAPNSPARGANPFGKDLGALVPSGAWITGEPPVQTPSTSATLTIGGPGIFSYKWKLDSGPWSAAIPIDPANPLHFPRNAPTKRTAQLVLTNLSNGLHSVSVVGQDFAGVWQEDAAATVSKTWTVNTSLQLIQMNEVLADSATLPDTIELANLGASSVSLAGWTLTDDPAVPGKVNLSAITIPAGGYATVTGLSLDRNGDTVYLYQGATLRDSIAFGNQIPEFTIGRIGTAGTWTLCTNNGTPGTVGTFGAANVAARLGDPRAVRLNEWFTSGDVLYDNDWIELANPSALPIDLGGLHITDNRPGDPLAHTFAPLTFIAANGFARFIADGHPEDGPSHLSFSLDAQQESIALLDASGATIDVVFYYPQTTDRSMGRDVGGNLVFYELPTRGFLNGTSDPAYANALALLRGLRITEIMFNAVGGSDFDYVELRNVGATPLALGGVHFVQGIDFTFPAMTLNAGQNVLVVKHLTKFRSRYGNGPNVAGVYNGQLDNGGETLGLQLPPPFDANVLTFRYEDAWYLSTDGGGTSLVVPNPLVNANIWGDKDTWTASGIGGNPDGASPTTLTFSGWSALHGVNSVSDDGDRDGVAALAEFSLGMSTEDPNGGNGQAGLPAIGRVGGQATLTFRIPENAAAAQNHGFADVIYNVQAANAPGVWTTIATKSFGVQWSGAANVTAPNGGFVLVTITDTAAAPGAPQRTLRLQVVWSP